MTAFGTPDGIGGCLPSRHSIDLWSETGIGRKMPLDASTHTFDRPEKFLHT
jgi:hypothetical protein